MLSSCGLAGGPSTTVPSESPTNLPASSAAAELGAGAIHGTYDVGGHEVFLDCTGTGTPTVVMFHGIIWDADIPYSPSTDWKPTRDLVDARTCSYDRRNVGESGQVPGMSIATDAVQDLHRLL
jgi:hypothetical protein